MIDKLRDMPTLSRYCWTDILKCDDICNIYACGDIIRYHSINRKTIGIANSIKTYNSSFKIICTYTYPIYLFRKPYILCVGNYSTLLKIVKSFFCQKYMCRFRQFLNMSITTTNFVFILDVLETTTNINGQYCRLKIYSSLYG